jgi:hypothetical protein
LNFIKHTMQDSNRTLKFYFHSAKDGKRCPKKSDLNMNASLFSTITKEPDIARNYVLLKSKQAMLKDKNVGKIITTQVLTVTTATPSKRSVASNRSSSEKKNKVSQSQRSQRF